MGSAISVRGVHFSYRQGFWLKRKPVLREVTFDVPEGAVFGLIGANGAGKTTLIQLLTGVRSPDAGEVSIFGLAARSREARRLIGFLPERPYFHPFLKGNEFLLRMAQLSDLHSPKAAVDRVLDLVGLTSVADRKLSSYSKGMLQRIGIAQAVLHDPKLVVMDEPMSGLDPNWRRQQRELIVKLAASGKTVFFSSHVVEDVESLCDGAACIGDSTFVFRGEEGWPVSGTEIIVTGLTSDKIDRPGWAVSELHQERNSLRVVLEPGAPVEQALEAMIRSGGKVRVVQSSPPRSEAEIGDR